MSEPHSFSRRRGKPQVCYKCLPHAFKAVHRTVLWHWIICSQFYNKKHHVHDSTKSCFMFVGMRLWRRVFLFWRRALFPLCENRMSLAERTVPLWIWGSRLPLLQTQTPSAKGHREAKRGSDRIKSSKSLPPSCRIRWGNSRRQGQKDMSTQPRNGGCLTLFPAFPSPSPFPCPTALPSTDCAACVVSCYCCETCDRFAPDCFSPVRAPYTHPESRYATFWNGGVTERLRKGGKEGWAGQ